MTWTPYNSIWLCFTSCSAMTPVDESGAPFFNLYLSAGLFVRFHFLRNVLLAQVLNPLRSLSILIDWNSVVLSLLFLTGRRAAQSSTGMMVTPTEYTPLYGTKTICTETTTLWVELGLMGVSTHCAAVLGICSTPFLSQASGVTRNLVVFCFGLAPCTVHASMLVV